MALTSGQKKRRNAQVEAARNADASDVALALWNSEGESVSAIVHWTRMYLLRNAKVWAAVKPLYLRDKYSNGGSLAIEGPEVLLENAAVTDQELVELEVAERYPLKVLRHPRCGDESLKVVALMWESGRSSSMDCVPNWATRAQVERMYELRPTCGEDNATYRAMALLSRLGY